MVNYYNTDVCKTFEKQHPINMYIPDAERYQLTKLKDTLADVNDTLKQVYNPEEITRLQDANYVSRLMEAKEKPEGVSRIGWTYLKYCAFNDMLKTNPELQKDCNMLLYAENAAKEAQDSIWFAQQNIAVPLGCPPVTRSGSRVIRKVGEDGTVRVVPYTDNDFYRTDQSVFASFTADLKGRKLL